MKKKRILSFATILSMALTMLPFDAFTVFALGDADNPIEIETAAELISFADRVEAGENTLCAKLTENISLNNETFTFIPETGLVNVTDGTNTAYLGTGIKGISSFTGEASVAGQWYDTTYEPVSSFDGDILVWTPIGKSDTDLNYNGIFDGNGKTVSGVYINRTADNSGLFGYLGSGTIKNLSVTNSYIHGGNNVGGVCGQNYGGTISGCSSSAVVSGVGQVGGVCGYNKSSVEKCYHTGAVTGSGNNVGGVCGNNGGTISDSYHTGAVSGSANLVGGVCGGNLSSVKNCYNTGAVSGGGNLVGGVCGYNSDSVEKCYNTGTVSGSINYVGGVCGSNFSSVENCYNTGTVSGSGSNVGGVCGRNTGGTISNSYHTGTISGSDNFVGGVCGNNGGGTISNCYYLTDCATDGNHTIQFGIGNAETGNTTADTAGSTTGKTSAGFASGEVAYLLNDCITDGTQLWYQTCGTGLPALSGSTVYAYHNCMGDDAYTNDSALAGTTADHNYTDGICTLCGDKQAPTKISGGEYDGYYDIKTAGNFIWFADRVEAGENTLCAKLTENISLNNETFTFIPETGLVNVTDGTNTAYLGTGIKGISSFTGEASVAGQWYDTSFSPVSSFEGDIHVWTPIGKFNTDLDYNGIFDGNGKTVSGVYINGTVNNTGLFGYIGSSGTIKNLNVTNSYIRGNYYVGGVCGYNDDGTITGCSSSAVVSGDSSVGGVCGFSMNGRISNCYHTGTVSGKGDEIGGVCGQNYFGTVTDSSNAGTVSGNGHKIGGVCGFSSIGEILDCYNTGTVSGSGCNIGGVCGNNDDGTISNCYHTGTVSGDYLVGGVCGENYDGTISNCYYLTGCAQDSNHTIQFGIGSDVKGNTTADTAGSTTGKTSAGFASGEVTWLLNTNGGTGNNSKIWAQNAENPVFADENTPVFHSATLYLESDISINYYVNKVDGQGTPSMSIYDMDGTLLQTILAVNGTGENADKWRYTFSGIAAKEVIDRYIAVCSNGGAPGAVIVYGVKDYCINQLNNTASTDKLKTLCADLLNYASEAQTYFHYKTETLANAEMTDSMKDHATNHSPTIESFTSLMKASEEKITDYRITAAGLRLENKVELYMNFVVPASEQDMHYLVKIAAEDGESVSVPITVAAGETVVRVNYDGFDAAQMRTKFTACLYDADGINARSNTFTYSIESYAAAKQAQTSNNLGALVVAMMKYGDSASNLFAE